MSDRESVSDVTPTLTFDAFWDWLTTHPNCILRAGSRHAVVYDDEDYHWHFGHEGLETLLVQVIRGKRLVGEILLPRQDIAFVQGVLGDQEGEFVFELISEEEQEQSAQFFFVLSHGYESGADPEPRRVH